MADVERYVHCQAMEGQVLTWNRSSIGKCRCRNFRSIHAPHQTPHESRRIRYSRSIRVVETARLGSGVPLLCKWASGEELVQGWRSVH